MTGVRYISSTKDSLVCRRFRERARRGVTCVQWPTTVQMKAGRPVLVLTRVRVRMLECDMMRHWIMTGRDQWRVL